MSFDPPPPRRTDRPFERHDHDDAHLDRVWRPAREVALEDAPPGAPRFLLHARFPDAAALSRSCFYADTLGGLQLVAGTVQLGDVVELVVTLDAGNVRLWCARGRVVRRRLRRGDAELDVELLADEVEAWNRLDSILMGVAPDKLDRMDARVAVKLSAQVKVPGGRARKLSTLDLSRSGVGVKSREPLPVGTAVELEVRQSFFSRPLHVRGLVCWEQRERGFGVKFLFDTDLQRCELDALLARLA